MKVARNQATAENAVARLWSAIELGRTDRDLSLLLTETLRDLGIELVDPVDIEIVDRAARVEQVRDVLSGWPVGSGYYTGQVGTDEAREMAEAVVDELVKDGAS